MSHDEKNNAFLILARSLLYSPVKGFGPHHTEKQRGTNMYTSVVELEVAKMIKRAQKAAEAFKEFTQEQVDRISEAMTKAGVANARKLAEMAVAETGIGNVEDKVIKNHFGTQVVYDYMKDRKSVGIISEDDSIMEIAEPFGIIAAVTPVTNPSATTFMLVRWPSLKKLA